MEISSQVFHSTLKVQKKSKMKRKSDLKRVVEVTRFSLTTSHYGNEQ